MRYGDFGYFWAYRISSLFLEVVSQILRFSSFIYWGYSLKEPPTTTQDCCGVIPEIPSHVWENSKYQVIPESSGYPLPIDFQNWVGPGRVLIKIPGIRSGWGTRWALVLLRETLICPPFWRLPPRPRTRCWQKLQRCRSPPLSLSLCCWTSECEVKSCF